MIKQTPLLVKQILGGVLGMLAAVGVYTLVQQVDFSSVGAMIVESGSIFSGSNQVRVNDKNVDQTTVDRLKQHAQQVASQMQTAQTAVASSAADSVADRRAQLVAFRRATMAQIAPATDATTNVATSADASGTLHAGADLASLQQTKRLSGTGPLTSTLVLLSLGIAAAVALVRRRSFAFSRG